jgi:hypothetical protein
LDLYFKVPAHWSTFDTKEIIEAENGKHGPTQLKQIAAGDWLEAMSSRPDVTAKESDGLGQRYPAAVVQVQQLGARHETCWPSSTVDRDRSSTVAATTPMNSWKWPRTTTAGSWKLTRDAAWSS